MSDQTTNSSDRNGTSSKPISRRNYLGYVGAGAGGMGLSAANVGALSVDDGIEIVFTRDKHGPRQTKVVSEDWYQQSLASRRSRDALKERFLDEPWAKAVGRTANDGSDDPTSFDVDMFVEATDVARARREVPETFDGFTVDVREYEEPEKPDCKASFSCVPGGADVNGCSATCVVENKYGYKRLMTASHCFSDSSCDDLDGETVYHHDKYIGKVSDYEHAADWAIMYESSYSDISGFDDDIYYRSDVEGHVSEDGWDYVLDRSYDVAQFGKMTCTTWGYLNEDRWTDMCFKDALWGYYSNDVEHGDSGGPYFIYNDNTGPWIMGPLVRMTSRGTVSSAAWEISQDHGISFGVPDSC